MQDQKTREATEKWMESKSNDLFKRSNKLNKWTGILKNTDSDAQIMTGHMSRQLKIIFQK